MNKFWIPPSCFFSNLQIHKVNSLKKFHQAVNDKNMKENWPYIAWIRGKAFTDKFKLMKDEKTAHFPLFEPFVKAEGFIERQSKRQ